MGSEMCIRDRTQIEMYRRIYSEATGLPKHDFLGLRLRSSTWGEKKGFKYAEAYSSFLGKGNKAFPCFSRGPASQVERTIIYAGINLDIRTTRDKK